MFKTIDDIKEYIRRVNYSVEWGVPKGEIPPGYLLDFISHDPYNLTDEELAYIAKEASRIRLEEANRKHNERKSQ